MYSKRKNKWRKTVNLKAKKYYFKITWFSKKGIFLKFLPNFGFPCPLCRLERQPFWQQAIFDNRMQELPPYYIIAQALNQSSPLFSLYMEEPCWAWLSWCWSFWPRQFAVPSVQWTVLDNCLFWPLKYQLTKYWLSGTIHFSSRNLDRKAGLWASINDA